LESADLKDWGAPHNDKHRKAIRKSNGTIEIYTEDSRDIEIYLVPTGPNKIFFHSVSMSTDRAGRFLIASSKKIKKQNVSETAVTDSVDKNAINDKDTNTSSKSETGLAK